MVKMSKIPTFEEINGSIDTDVLREMLYEVDRYILESGEGHLNDSLRGHRVRKKIRQRIKEVEKEDG